jgi:hypothetical protein
MDRPPITTPIGDDPTDDGATNGWWWGGCGGQAQHERTMAERGEAEAALADTVRGRGAHEAPHQCLRVRVKIMGSIIVRTD